MRASLAALTELGQRPPLPVHEGAIPTYKKEPKTALKPLLQRPHSRTAKGDSRHFHGQEVAERSVLPEFDSYWAKWRGAENKIP